jgi:putative addiction module component (TIGR02574 family)
MSIRDEIVQQALALPADDRAFLADLLEQSLQDAHCSPESLTAFWTVEIDRRLTAYGQDPSQAVDANTSLTNIRRHLQTHRLGKSE